MELSRLTITRWRDISMAPRERQTETIMGSMPGVRPTATAMENLNASHQSCLVMPLMMNTSGAMTTRKRIINQVKRATPRSKAVGADPEVMAVDIEAK